LRLAAALALVFLSFFLVVGLGLGLGLLLLLLACLAVSGAVGPFLASWFLAILVIVSAFSFGERELLHGLFWFLVGFEVDLREI
jgi:hypothetical protein